MKVNEFEKGLLYSCSALLGLGLQFTLPLHQQLKLTHYSLIFTALTLPIAYYCILSVIKLCKLLYNLMNKEFKKQKSQ